MEYSSFDKLNNTSYYYNTNNNYINKNNNSDSDSELFKGKKQIKYDEYIINFNNDLYKETQYYYFRKIIKIGSLY